MNVIDINRTNQGGGGKTVEVVFDLSTLEKSRETFSAIVEAYANGGISETRARCLGYLMSNLLPYWKLEKDIQIEKDVEEIKQILRDRGDLK